MKEFGSRLRQARLAKGLTQAEFIELVDPTLIQSRYSRYESGKSVPRTERLNRMIEVLGVNPEWLLPTQESSDPEVVELRRLLLEAERNEVLAQRENLQLERKLLQAEAKDRELEELRDNLVQLSSAIRAAEPTRSWPPEIQAILDKYPDDPMRDRIATLEDSWNLGPVKPHTEKAPLAARKINKKGRKPKGE